MSKTAGVGKLRGNAVKIEVRVRQGPVHDGSHVKNIFFRS